LCPVMMGPVYAKSSVRFLINKENAYYLLTQPRGVGSQTGMWGLDQV
jgi:hypothetical protein